MRSIVVLLIVVGGCAGAEDAPPSRRLAAGVDAASIALAGEDVYWAGRRGGAGHVERIGLDGVVATVAEGGRAADHVVVGERVVYWSRSDEDGAEARLMVTDEGGTRDVTPPDHTQVIPFATGWEDTVFATAVTLDGRVVIIEPRPGHLFVRAILPAPVFVTHVAGRAVTPTFFLRLGDPCSDTIYAFNPHGGVPALGAPFATGVHGCGGVAGGIWFDDPVYVRDGDGEDQPATVYRRDGLEPAARPVGTVDGPVVGPWLAGGRLWLVETSPVEHQLIAVDPDTGALTRYWLDRKVTPRAMNGAGFVSLADGELRWQPLPPW